jgi:cell division protein FtsB
MTNKSVSSVQKEYSKLLQDRAVALVEVRRERDAALKRCEELLAENKTLHRENESLRIEIKGLKP